MVGIFHGSRRGPAMRICVLCRLELGRNHSAYDRHDACGDEWQRRRNDGECVNCGTSPARIKDIRCAGCGEDSRYVGYPPGA